MKKVYCSNSKYALSTFEKRKKRCSKPNASNSVRKFLVEF